MKKNLQLPAAQNPSYRDFTLRLFFALLAAHYILSHTSKYGFFEVITVNGYLISLAYSFGIALLLLQTVYYITTYLDRKIPYTRHWKKRLCLQIVFGILGVALLAIALACSFFWLNNLTARLTPYLSYDFPIILAFIININVYYFIRYALFINNKLLARLQSEDIKNTTQGLQQDQALTQTKPNEQFNQIACIVKMQRKYMVVYNDARSFAWFIPIKRSMQELSKNEYFIINPRCLVARDCIVAVKPILSKRYKVTLKAAIQEKVRAQDLIVSQTNKLKFQKWYAGQP